MTSPSNADYLNLSQAVYTTGGATPVAPSGWTLMTDSNGAIFQNDGFGMQAAAFQNNTTHQIVIAFEGTNRSNATTANAAYLTQQLKADGQIAAGTTPQADPDSVTFAQRVAAAAGSNPVYVTGHSLGGEEAEYVKNASNNPTNGITIAGGETFGAPGVPLFAAVTGNNPTLIDYEDVGDPPEDIPAPNDLEYDDFLWEELCEAAKEDVRMVPVLYSFFVVAEARGGRSNDLFISPDWPSAEAYAKARIIDAG